jgi:hypothetical protein
MPLIQYALAGHYHQVPEAFRVGVQRLNGTDLVVTQYSADDIQRALTAAQRAVDKAG